MENQYEVPDNLEIDEAVEPQEVISLNKFVILCILTFGLYQIWWIYKAWRFFQQKDRLDIMPAARTIFSIIFLNSLFKRILSFAREKDYEEDYTSELLVAGFIIFNIMARLPDFYWLVSVLGVIFLIQPFKAFNYARVNASDLIVTERTSFSGRHIVLIVLGSIMWILVLIGLFFGVES
ncbi:hypothetical protein [Dyadobacter psychrotolerans]|uniref:DUF4234 domain-containing protein n=1 Tax=Dyadobacter psychrotolerans TaxID=2541721 RepID=A0A4R5DE91_9BACT|nr:hypothetical protein [Dyadobacter psychrotolerans]TDE12109.1 hypothetical protein E0F88_23990 [Dyadobacter psychrotolerans]